MASVERHAEISANFLERAEDSLRAGDLLQASEKAWGAVAHCLKSIAERRNLPHGSHAALTIIVNRLANESDEHNRVIQLYRRVGFLHSNFYEDWFKRETVARGVRSARELTALLQEIA